MRRWRFVAATLFACAVVALPATAQVQVDFSPSTVNLQVGESALVEVRVTGVPVPGLAAFQFDLDYDTIPIDLLNPNEAFRGTISPFAPLGGDPLCTTVRGTGTCNDPVWLLTSTGRTPLGTDLIDDASGHLEVAWATSGAAALPTGDGAIALIEVQGPYDGTSVVQLTNLILADNQQPPMTYATVTGSLTVVVGTGVANQPPVLATVGPQSIFEGQSLSVPLSATDGDGDGLTLSASGLPAFCSLTDAGGGSGSLDCTPAPGDSALYPLTLSATDDGAPNLTDSENVDLDVLPSTCVDVDGDGYGFPGDLSCPAGAVEDCDDTDPDVNPAGNEKCRNGADDDCNGTTDAADPICPASICAEIALGVPGSDPALTLGDPTACPTGGTLVRNADLIWGDLTGLQIIGVEVRLGGVNAVACSNAAGAHLFDSLAPDPGSVDFILVRETGAADYGASSAAEARQADSGGCP